jgi:hypothetical protein
MIDDELSELPKSALRDYAEDPRIERVWHRLDSGFRAPAPRARPSLWLAPAMGVLLFGLGVFVGRHSGDVSSSPIAVLSAEPQPQPALPTQRAETQPPNAEHAGPVASSATNERRRSAPARAALAATAAERESDGSRSAPPPPQQNPPVPSGPPEWQLKADTGDFGAARSALDRSGGWDAALASASPEQLMTLVDVARASGEREPAVRALRRLLNGYAGAPEAPLAAWTLGNLLEQGGDRAGAADAYALYRRLSPAGDFAEDAAAREVDVALSGDNYELAVQLVEQYARDFPAGRRLAEFREELQKLETSHVEGGVTPSSGETAPSATALPSSAPPPPAGTAPATPSTPPAEPAP